MDITPPLPQNKQTTIAVSKTDSFNLKVNQQLEVKIISSKTDAQTLALEITSSKKTLQVQSNQSFEAKSGQTLTLVVTKSSPAAEFKVLNDVLSKVLNKEEIILKQAIPTDQIKKAVESTKNFTTPVIISAKILAITDDTVQLKLYTSPSLENSAYNKQQQNILQQKNPIITLTKEQLISTEPKKLEQSLKQLANYKPGQKIQLEVNKSGINPEFKIANNPKFNPKQGQIITATVIGLKNNQLQLQIPTNKSSSIISIDKQHLISSSPELSIGALKKGEKIQLEVVKNPDQISFKLLPQPVNSEQKIVDTIKQLFPTQQPPSELINQLLDKLPVIHKNENIPDALKRLAREILNSTPQLKDVNPKQLKKLFSQSGLFLEANLVQAATSKKSTIDPADFKGLLLKFQQALKQELDIKKDTKAQSTEVNLLKEMQQKTESSLAKTILNQFASLPREDSTRNVWILDLPFLNKENAETVRVEIDKEQQQENTEDRENWTVSVTITPQERETIYCKISCYDQTINTLFWSDNEEVVDEIDQHLDYLKSQLEKAGLNPGRMSANKGVPTAQAYQKIKGQTLFDQKV